MPESPEITGPAVVSFSTRIREATAREHEAAENSTFITEMLDGSLGIDSYRRYTGQLWFIYRALKAHAETLAADPVAGPFIKPELARTAELERDLGHLAGPGWREGLAARDGRLRRAHRGVRPDLAGWLYRPPLHPLSR